jgi:hypothetical protein
MKLLLQPSWLLGDNREIAVQRFPFVIGRRAHSDCSLMLAFVSRRHCQFVRLGDEVLVQDLKSRNGTFLNGKRASRALPVQDGDERTVPTRPRAPLAFKGIMTIPQPTAFLALIHGHDGSCRRVRRYGHIARRAQAD